MHLAHQAKQQVLAIQYLPPLSVTATRLLALFGNEDLSLKDLSETINQDPGLSAKVLGLANSAYFGQSQPVLSVEDAIIRVLGLNMVKSLAFSIALSGVFDTTRCPGFDLRTYWFDSLTLAVLSRQVGVAMAIDRRPNLDAVYLAGLLSNIGVLVLAHSFPDAFAEVLHKRNQSHKPPGILQTECIGLDQNTAGALLADRWHLPRIIIEVIERVGKSSDESPEDTDAPVVVRIVDQVAHWLRDEWEQPEMEQVRLQTLSRGSGLSVENLLLIKKGFLLKEEEIKGIAGLLAN
ncbi:MAG: HDOD domain-containing protein [Candidatus Thiodiazotropha sp.]|jgi:HD-like signal output (HDOD) protein